MVFLNAFASARRKKFRKKRFIWSAIPHHAFRESISSDRDKGSRSQKKLPIAAAIRDRA